MIELYHGSVKCYKAFAEQQQYLQNRLNSRKPLKLFSCEAFPEYVIFYFLTPSVIGLRIPAAAEFSWRGALSVRKWYVPKIYTVTSIRGCFL